MQRTLQGIVDVVIEQVWKFYFDIVSFFATKWLVQREY